MPADAQITDTLLPAIRSYLIESWMAQAADLRKAAKHRLAADCIEQCARELAAVIGQPLPVREER
jgi:hypothetical protein